jgi:ribosomal protein S9
MPSIKDFKKELNNNIGGFIEEVYIWELSNPEADLKKSEKLIDEAIVAFDKTIEKVNHVKGGGFKKQFKAIREELTKMIGSMNDKLAKLA